MTIIHRYLGTQLPFCSPATYLYFVCFAFLIYRNYHSIFLHHNQNGEKMQTHTLTHFISKILKAMCSRYKLSYVLLCITLPFSLSCICNTKEFKLKYQKQAINHVLFWAHE
jgi:hypothetical protein